MEFSDKAMYAALMVDLDGTIRKSKGPKPFPTKASEVEVFPEAIEALAFWRSKGYALLGVTNQGGLASGSLTKEQFMETFQETQRQLKNSYLDDVKVAGGPPDSEYRKPSPAMGLELTSDYNLSLPDCFHSGDLEVDAQFAENLGISFLPSRNLSGFEPPDLPLYLSVFPTIEPRIPNLDHVVTPLVDPATVAQAHPEPSNEVLTIPPDKPSEERTVPEATPSEQPMYQTNPDEQSTVTKFSVGEDLKDLNNQDLEGAHFYAHTAYNKLKRGMKFSNWSVKDVEDYHKQVVDELTTRGMKHNSPLGEQPATIKWLVQHVESHAKNDSAAHDEAVKSLSDLGIDHPDEDPDNELDMGSISKGLFLPVRSSGVEKGDEVGVSQILEALSGKTAHLRLPFVYLTGGVANRGKTNGDVDLLMRCGSKELGDRLKYLIEWRILRGLPTDIAKRVHFLYEDQDHGPFTNHVPLFALTLTPVDPVQVQMSLDLIKSVNVGTYYQPVKPLKPVKGEDRHTLASFISFFSGKTWPWEVTKKYDGVHCQIHVKGSSVKVWTEDGTDVTARLPGLVAEAKKLAGTNNVILDCEIEKWSGRTHLPREIMAAYLNTKSAADDTGVIANCFDTPYLGEDLTGDPLEKRRSTLKTLSWPQSTMGIPNLTSKFNLAPEILANSPRQMTEAVARTRYLPGSEGVVAKLWSSKYPQSTDRTEDWIKFHNTATVTAAVIEAIETKTPGTYNYRYGLRRGDKKLLAPPEKAGNFTVHAVGKTFSTSRKLNPGDLVTIEFETLNYSETPEGIDVGLWVPRVVSEPPKSQPTTVGAAMKAAERERILASKEEPRFENAYKSDQTILDSALSVYLQDESEDILDSSCKVKGDQKDSRLLVVRRSAYEKGDLPAVLAKLLKLEDPVCVEINPEETSYVDLALSTFENPVIFNDKQVLYIGKDGLTSESFANAGAKNPEQERYHRICAGQSSDIFLDVPGEDKKYKYVIQRHFRGKSSHIDLRMESGEKDLIGWTVADLVRNEIKEPVLTLEDARSVPQTAFKIDLKTGDLVYRPARSGSEPVRAEAYATRKAPEPHEWLTYEGVVPTRTEDADSAGGTRNFPGVFLICDKGQVFYGAQKAHLHEYFFQGGALHGRYFFRQLPTSSVTKANRFIPSESADFRSELVWVVIQPDDQQPYVLSNRAVEKGWMPPTGRSALPPWVKNVVPDEFKYWKRVDDARAVRDALVEAIKSRKISINYEFSKSDGTHEAEFSLQRQIFKGPTVVRESPTLVRWHFTVVNDVRWHFLAEGPSPFEAKEASILLTEDFPWSKMSYEGPVAPGSVLNETKDTPSEINIEDSGTLNVMIDEPNLKRINIDGVRLNGTWDLTLGEGNMWSLAKVTKDSGE